jgi:Uma2 family endonuclease
VVEVSSPSTARFDRGIKRERYLAAGVQEVWLVDTASEAVEIGDRVLTVGESITSSLLPGFSLSVGELFDR